MALSEMEVTKEKQALMVEVGPPKTPVRKDRTVEDHTAGSIPGFLNHDVIQTTLD